MTLLEGLSTKLRRREMYSYFFNTTMYLNYLIILECKNFCWSATD